jgi:hypothetical protein
MNQTTHASRRLAIMATATLALLAPLPAQADPPGDWPRRTSLADQAASVRPDDRPGPRGNSQARPVVRPDDRADRRIATAADDGATMLRATGKQFEWGNALGLTLFLAAMAAAVAAMRYTHVMQRSAS